MTRDSLLPPNSTALERALETASARLLDIPPDNRLVWSPDDCPPAFLPWLAWGLSLDSWSSNWPEETKRARVRSAIPIARQKGTVGSVRAVIESFGGHVEIREWWQRSPRGAPFSFDLLLDLDRDGAPASAEYVNAVIAEVQRTKPVRSPFSFTQQINAQGQIGMLGVARPAIFARIIADALPTKGFYATGLIGLAAAARPALFARIRAVAPAD